jgi:GTP:adenosylcobinamide-phosphate guanylyltransferase
MGGFACGESFAVLASLRSAQVNVLDAVVLAGGPGDAVAALEPGAPNKAFVRIGGRALVARTIGGLRASSRIDRIVAVAPPSAAAHPALAGASEVRGDGARMIDSLRSGLAGFVGDRLVLIAAADLPALDAAAVDEFVDRVLERDLDLAYACVERHYHDAAFREFPHTWARLREGRFCGGGVVALRPRVLPELALLLDALGNARKSPWRLAGLFGWDVLLRFALGQLSIAQAEARGSRLISARVGAIRCTQAQIALNVDRVEDVAKANARFGG